MDKITTKNKIQELEEILIYKGVTEEEKIELQKEINSLYKSLLKPINKDNKIKYSKHGIHKTKDKFKSKRRCSRVARTTIKGITNKKIRQDKLFSINGLIYKFSNKGKVGVWD